MNFTITNMLDECKWFYMFNTTMKLMLGAIIMAAASSLIQSKETAFIVGCLASVLFGYMLDIFHTLAKQEISKQEKLHWTILVFKFFVAISFSWGAGAFWLAYFKDVNFWMVLYLFVCSMMASVFTELLIKGSTIGFGNIIKTMLQRIASTIDKDEEAKP